jgi:hypothetical protein
MGVRSLSAASISTGAKRSKFWDQSAVEIITSYESIATATVTSGGAAYVEFTSIPSTYTHLQIRGIAQVSRATYGIGDGYLRFNGDSGANYSWHNVRSVGSGAAQANPTPSDSQMSISDGMFGTTTGGSFGVIVIDILDYKNTSKHKVVRALTGTDFNGTIAGYGGFVGLNSGSWRNTGAVTDIRIIGSHSGFTQHTKFALYGIKGA